MAFLLQNRVNSTLMSLGMLVPVCCPRTDRSQCCTQSKPARAAVGEHLSSKLMVEMGPLCLKPVLIPALSTLLRQDLASCSEETWALTKRCCNLCVPAFIILGYIWVFFKWQYQLCPLYSNFEQCTGGRVETAGSKSRIRSLS